MSGSFPPMKNPRKAASGSKGGKMRQAPNREAIQASRMKQAFEMRLQGRTFEQIGEKFGISRERARVLHDEALQATVGEGREMAARVKNQQLTTLEMVEVRLLELLLDPRLKVRKKSPDGSVVELADFEALNRLNASLVKNLRTTGESRRRLHAFSVAVEGRDSTAEFGRVGAACSGS